MHHPEAGWLVPPSLSPSPCGLVIIFDRLGSFLADREPFVDTTPCGLLSGGTGSDCPVSGLLTRLMSLHLQSICVCVCMSTCISQAWLPGFLCAPAGLLCTTSAIEEVRVDGHAFCHRVSVCPAACKGEHCSASLPIASAGHLPPPPPPSVCVAPLALSTASLSEPSSAAVRSICSFLGWGFGIDRRACSGSPGFNSVSSFL